MPKPVELDCYESLGVNARATQQEIESAYRRRAAELRASKIEDAPEELAEVEEAHAVLGDPEKRARYDAQVRDAEAEDDKKYAEMDAYLQRSGRRHPKTNRRNGGVLGTILDLLSFWK